MKIRIKIIVSILFIMFMINGCAKDVEEYNKPAAYWYGKIVDSISQSNLEKADSYYGSLQGEHIGSPLLPEATMILAIAHMHNQEYLLSEHFFDEYIRRYANENEREFAKYMIIKSKYLSLPNPRRDQILINEAIQDGEKFKKEYPHSMYYPLVNTMLTRLYMAQAALNETIASLYDRLGKPKSAAYYRSIDPEPWIKWDDVQRADTPWYKEWFEGDGKSSWYGYIIPKVKSVVSRNSVKEETK